MDPRYFSSALGQHLPGPQCRGDLRSSTQSQRNTTGIILSNPLGNWRLACRGMIPIQEAFRLPLNAVITLLTQQGRTDPQRADLLKLIGS